MRFLCSPGAQPDVVPKAVDDQGEHEHKGEGDHPQASEVELAPADGQSGDDRARAEQNEK